MADNTKISQLTTNGTTYDLVDSRISDTNITNWNNLNSGKIFYGTSSSGASSAAKVVTCSSFTSDDLVAGTIIFVYFTYNHTTTSCTLNINSTGAKNAYRLGTSAITSGTWDAASMVGFVYNGTSWYMIEQQLVYQQTSTTTLNNNLPIMLGTTTSTGAITGSLRKSGNLIYNPSTKALYPQGTSGVNLTAHTHAISGTVSGKVLTITVGSPE